MTHAESYLELGLRLGKHVDGLVDAYYGPAELKKQVDFSEPRVRINTDLPDADALGWDESAAWDDMARYYQSPPAT